MNQKQNFKVLKCMLGAVLSIFLILLDQVTKYLAIVHLKGNAAIPIWKGVFELQYLENQGAAFGILQGKKMILILFTTVLLVALLYLFFTFPAGKRYYWVHIICVLYISGAIGNFIDRVRYNYVVDFFYFKLINFPIFNIADIYVVAASIMMLISIFYYKEEDYEKMFPSKKKKEEVNE
ncbi:MAG: signal peptidase II [Roseburia sp.]